MPGVLYEQNYDRGRDMLPPPKEGRVSISHSGQETSLILPRAHHLCGDAVLGASHISKVRFHRPDFKVGSEDRRFGRKVPTKNSHKGVDPS